ncbi:MAG TPA: AraC family transcriptional regulator [Chthoniobacteraceae bacterium]|nr:AraC family transcriptional regulator [Chthoniobacteraceae bacterium]
MDDPDIPSAPPIPRMLPWSDWTIVRCGLSWVYDGLVNPRYRVLREYLPEQAAILIRQGSMEVAGREGKVTGKVGEWIFLNEGFIQRRFSKDARILSIRFHWRWPGGQPLFEWPLAVCLASAAFPRLETEGARLEKAVRERYCGGHLTLPGAMGDLDSYLEVQHFFMAWLQAYAASLSGQGYPITRCEIGDPRILQAVRILDHQPLEHPLREAGLAAQVHLSPGQLNRLFGQQFGLSPFRYLERRRFAEAMARLRGSDTPLKRIALELGFNSLSHFSSWFRRKTQVSPNEFRKTGPSA